MLSARDGPTLPPLLSEAAESREGRKWRVHLANQAPEIVQRWVWVPEGDDDRCAGTSAGTSNRSWKSKL